MPGPDLPYIVLDRRAFEKAGVDEKAAEDAVAALLPEAVASQDPATPTLRCPPSIAFRPRPRWPAVRTRGWSWPMASCRPRSGAPAGPQLRRARQLVRDAGAGRLSDGGNHRLAGTTHFSPWSYDRHVPLAFYGAPFVPGEYHERVAPVDLAVTLASLAGINQPSAAVGRVLTEAIKPIKQAAAQ
jgi:hypothetical protein